jgi:hypothetical protein
MSVQVRLVKPSSPSEKQTRTTVDTVELTRALVSSWRLPKFQRELKVNAKVLALAEEIKQNGGVLPGMLTIGVFEGKPYKVDGQHRIEAWGLSGLDVGYADVRTHYFDSMADMALEYVRLNSSLVKLRPDDIMRGLESSTPALQRIRRHCPFIGYDMIRRSELGPVLSMSVFVRTWVGSRPDVPHTTMAAVEAVSNLDVDETTHAIAFITICEEAWGRDREYARLWGALNLSLCAWLYRRIVLSQSSALKRATSYSADDFRKGMMALSAEPTYLDWLVGRNSGERDRAPAFARMKILLHRRYLADTDKKPLLPSPAWAHQ